MPDEIPSLEDFFTMFQMLGMGTRTIGEFLTEHQDIADEMKEYDPVRLAATIGSLLTKPELQSNCCRLEILLHMALTSAAGRKKPDKASIIRWFKRLGDGVCGRLEDPAEDVFVTSIETATGNYCVLEGLWESNGFYLQRVVNIVGNMPDGPPYTHIKKSIQALLKLSDMVCERAKLSRFDSGNNTPLQILPANLLGSLAPYAAVKFTESEIVSAGIEPIALSPFCLQPDSKDDIPDESVGHTSVERRPIIHNNDSYYLVLPTAVGITIRRFVVEIIDSIGMRNAFLKAMGQEYAKLVSETPILGGPMRMPLRFQKTPNGIFSSSMIEIDKGHFLGFIFVLDELTDFETYSFSQSNPNPEKYIDALNYFISGIKQEGKSRAWFRSGIILIVGCGIGRGAAVHFDNPEDPNWKVEAISAADLITLSWIAKFKPPSLHRILEAREKLNAQGVSLENCNGLVNLVAWSQKLKGHLVPHGILPDEFESEDAPRLIMIEQNSLLGLRTKVLNDWDPHVVQNVEGKWIRVRKQRISLLEEGRNAPLYHCMDSDISTYPASVYLGKRRTWWCEIEAPEGTPGANVYEYSKMLAVWMERIVPVMEPLLGRLPDGPILWRTHFVEIGEISFGQEPLSFEEAKKEILIEAEEENRTLTLKVSKRFENALFNPVNIAERAIVSRAVEGLALLASKELSEDEITTLVEEIIPDDMARHIHAFQARNFRDYVRPSIPPSPITIDQYDDATLRLGLGWRFHKKSDGNKLQGKEQCVEFLNRLVRELENEVCHELEGFDRAAFIFMALQNHESAAIDRDQWNSTAGASLSLHDDKRGAMDEIVANEAKLNSAFFASRLLVEFAVCECPLEGGKEPNKLEFSKLMAKVNAIAHMSGWSDSIRWDVMEPTLKITPLGDVFANLDFFEQVMTPYSRAGTHIKIESSIENYAENLDTPKIRPSTESVLDPEFQQAWKDEFGFSVDEMRTLVDFLEDLGIRKQQSVLILPRSEILDVNVDGIKISKEAAIRIIDRLTLNNRPTWRDVPEGYNEKDIHSWRFRRRLSVIRKPIIQINDESDPTIIVAPGLVRDSLVYILSNFIRGDFPDWQIESSSMRKWVGKARGKREEFNSEVAEKFRELGWDAEADINVTKVLKKGFPDKNYGDIDVLAWNTKDNRVLIIECKDLQFKKTPGEIAEQLADFRGEQNADGKRDHLLRHLDRLDLILKHPKEITDFTKVQDPKIEGYLVFKNPVPMQYAWEHLKERSGIITFDDLDGFHISTD